MPRVYLAGKVGHTDWRHSIFPLRHVELRYDKARDLVLLDQSPLTGDGFEYAGPYFLGDDHGCFHGPSQHGIIDPGWADGHSMDDPDFPQVIERRTVMQSCLNWLKNADVVFCWLDSLDAYGTLVELGYAKALGIPIYLAPSMHVQAAWSATHPQHAEELPTEEEREAWEHDSHRMSSFFGWEAWADIWFARAIATRVDSEWTARDAWTDFHQWWARDMARTWEGRRVAMERLACRTHKH